MTSPADVDSNRADFSGATRFSGTERALQPLLKSLTQSGRFRKESLPQRSSAFSRGGGAHRALSPAVSRCESEVGRDGTACLFSAGQAEPTRYAVELNGDFRQARGGISRKYPLPADQKQAG